MYFGCVRRYCWAMRQIVDVVLCFATPYGHSFFVLLAYVCARQQTKTEISDNWSISTNTRCKIIDRITPMKELQKKLNKNFNKSKEMKETERVWSSRTKETKSITNLIRFSRVYQHFCCDSIEWTRCRLFRFHGGFFT